MEIIKDILVLVGGFVACIVLFVLTVTLMAGCSYEVQTKDCLHDGKDNNVPQRGRYESNGRVNNI